MRNSLTIKLPMRTCMSSSTKKSRHVEERAGLLECCQVKWVSAPPLSIDTSSIGADTRFDKSHSNRIAQTGNLDPVQRYLGVLVVRNLAAVACSDAVRLHGFCASGECANRYR
jgi:hypothetical protein